MDVSIHSDIYSCGVLLHSIISGKNEFKARNLKETIQRAILHEARRLDPAEDWVRTLGRRIVKLDIKVWGQKNGFCRLGEGDVNWPEVQKALVKIGFSGWATREGRDKSLEDTIALTKKLLG